MEFDRCVKRRSMRCDAPLVKARGTSGFCIPWLL